MVLTNSEKTNLINTFKKIKINNINQFDESYIIGIVQEIRLKYNISDVIDWYLNLIYDDMTKSYYYSEISFYKKIIILKYIINICIQKDEIIANTCLDRITLLVKKYQDFMNLIHGKNTKLILDIINDINVELQKFYGNSSITDNIELKEENTNLQQRIEAIEKEKTELNNQIAKLNSQNTAKDNKNAKLEDKIKQLKFQKSQDNTKLNNYLKELKKQKEAIESLRSANDDYIDSINFLINGNEKKELAKDQIISALFKKALSLEEIKTLLVKNGHSFSYDEIYGLINEIDKVDIQERIKNGKELYFYINIPKYEQNKIFDLGIHNKPVYDILVTADYHISLLKSSRSLDLENISKIGEYCNKNDIDIVLNLGDVFSVNHVNLNEKNKINKLNLMIESIMKVKEKYVFIPNVYQLILGGNHDMLLFDLENDFLRFLTEGRYDLIQLGYCNAFLKIGSSMIALHHPNERFGKSDNDYTLKYFLDRYLNKFYKQVFVSSDKIDLNLFAHFHNFKFYDDKESIFVPSFLRDRVQNGALHLKVYMKNNYIDHIEVISLINDDKKLKEVETYNYKKRTLTNGN